MTELTDRKKDHIQLAIESATDRHSLDRRFYYEPLLTTHPGEVRAINGFFLKKAYRAPIWVSSMTGGTQWARHINHNLARACGEFGLGMGLGSCRKLLDSDEFFEDFNVRSLMPEQALYANLGIAQVIELILTKKLYKLKELVNKLEADGLIIHVNPTQEWLQPEGDRITGLSPLIAIKKVLDHVDFPIIVKEVGQGMGPLSVRCLMELPLAAIEFGAYGGTNFAKLENLRHPETKEIDPLCYVGHTADEMIDFVHEISQTITPSCKEYIISGGVKTYLDGYYYNERLRFNSVYGQAASFLEHARESYDKLASFVDNQISGYQYALRYLSLRNT